MQVEILKSIEWKTKTSNPFLDAWILNPNRAGIFGPISQPGGGGGGGGGFCPPKISETDWRNIKCVVLVDSYDPPESIGTKKKYKHTLYDATVMS